MAGSLGDFLKYAALSISCCQAFGFSVCSKAVNERRRTMEVGHWSAIGK